MREHQLVPHAPGTDVAHALPQPTRIAAGCADADAGGGVARPATTSTCPVHPGEPLQFFCLECATECICAECAVQQDGAHRGHDVVNVRRAYQQLAGDIIALLETARLWSKEHQQAAKQTEVLRQDLNRIIAQGKQSVEDSLGRLHAAFREKEQLLLSSADEYAKATDWVLAQHVRRAEASVKEIWEARAALRSLGTGGDEVGALNSYASARAAVAGLLAQPPGLDGRDAADLFDRTKATVEDGVRLQVTSVTSFTARVPEIWHAAGFDAVWAPKTPVRD